jgi:hypothetical protein
LKTKPANEKEHNHADDFDTRLHGGLALGETTWFFIHFRSLYTQRVHRGQC